MRLSGRAVVSLGFLVAVVVVVLSYHTWRASPVAVQSQAVPERQQETQLENRAGVRRKLSKDDSGKVPGGVTSRSYVEGDVTLPSLSVLKNLSHKEAADLYHSYVNNLQTFCGRMARLGLASDGGWEVCEDDVFRPRKPCLVYSFGINNDWSFDDAVSKKYGCEVHSFDPSMGQGDHKHSQNVFFHATGLAAYNGSSPQKWKMRTLTSVMADLGHLQSTIDILKMDIEESEWTVIPNLLATRALDRVNQFLFEMHLTIKSVEPDRTKYVLALTLLKGIHLAGFRTFFTHRNHWCHFKSKFGPERIGCHELYMIRVPKS